MKPVNNIWIQKEQCPCGDWKCFIKYEGEEQGQACQPTKDGTSSSSLDVIFTPYVGQIFRSDDEAFQYYINFARKNGFSIRKARSTESHNLGVYRRDFVCYRSGFNQPRKKVNVEHPRDRKSVRCGCDAKLYLTKEIVNGVTQWYVSQFSNVHNHELLEDDQVRLLPAYRKIQEADQDRILLLSKAGFPVNRIIKVLELEKGVQSGKLPFIEKDIRNFVRTCKKTVQENDAILAEKRINDVMELLEACKAMSERDGEFVFDYLADENGKVENIAWSYGDSIRAYNIFGDAVQFDVTYKSITYGMLLGLLSGIDSHGKPIFFACVLLQEGNSHAFVWALQAFVRFMQGRHPQTIVTDLDPGLRDAIASELPNTKHVISLWYVMSKLSSWFSLSLGLKYSEFKSDFEMVSYVDSIEGFEHYWNLLIARFGLGSDKHISLLSSYRTSWAFSYIRDLFVARITTAEYMRSLENFLKSFLNEQTCLQVFFEQVGLAANYGYGAKENLYYTHPKTSMPVEDSARTILTPFAFNAFQHELVLSVQYAVVEMAKGPYVVRHYKKVERECLLTWNLEDELVHCSCKGFEHSGILCRHALRLFSMKNYFHLPNKYFPFRWRLESSLVPLNQESTQPVSEEFSHALKSLCETLVTESSVSKEKVNYACKELTTLLDHVKNMPVDVAPPDMYANSFSKS